ncbi:ribonuclease Z [Candidatus Pacearchaeota archaeon]|nr:ribonuclease Z [Candidatus Pacearchaeota archaeon]
MAKINLTFLGTSSAIPTDSRNHISMFLNYKNENILIDCGEGTQRQIRKAKINPCSITRLLITHFHGDHVFGLPGLFQTLALNHYNKTLYVYGPKGTKKFINEIFKTFIGVRVIKMQVNEVRGKFLKTKDFEITALPLNHDAPTNGYLFEEKDKLRIDKNKLKNLQIPNILELAKLTQKKNIKYKNKTINYKSITYLEKGKKISIILDTGLCSNINKLTKNSDLAIIESTFLEDSENGEKLAKEYKHLTAKQAAKIAKQNKVKQLILTHISQRYEKNSHLLAEEARKVFPNTKISNDFDVIVI